MTLTLQDFVMLAKFIEGVRPNRGRGSRLPSEAQDEASVEAPAGTQEIAEE